MNEATLTLKGKQKRDFSKLKSVLEELGFTSIAARKDRLSVEKIEISDLKGNAHHSYKATFYSNRLVFSYSLGSNRQKRDLDAFTVLINLLKVSEDFYTISAGELRTQFLELIGHVRSTVDSESHSTAHDVLDLREKYDSLEKKYRDLVLSSEQNARILLDCEKKKNEYHGRMEALEGMSDESLSQEIFKWLKTHSGEISISGFAKSYSVPTARVEEGLELLLRKGYIKKK